MFLCSQHPPGANDDVKRIKESMARFAALPDLPQRPAPGNDPRPAFVTTHTTTPLPAIQQRPTLTRHYHDGGP